MSSTTPSCPDCGSSGVVPIAYGYPTGEMWEEAERGEIAIGGCIVAPDNPDWRCNDCGHAWQDSVNPRWPQGLAWVQPEQAPPLGDDTAARPGTE